MTAPARPERQDKKMETPNVTKPGGRKGDYLYGVDAIRFLAALMVAFFHLTWYDAATPEVGWFGWVGVQIFFVLSGFVIANSANGTTPLAFLRSRVLRLYPAAWVCAVLSLAVLTLAPQSDSSLLRPFLTSLALAPTGPWIATAYWTLPIEIVFYALILLLLLRGAFHRLEWLGIGLTLAGSAYLAAYALQVAGVIHGPSLEFGYGVRNLTLLRHGIYFATGIFLWLWSRRRLSRAGALALLLAVLMAPVEMTCRTLEIVEKSPGHLDAAAIWPWPILLWVLACGGIVASVAWRGEIARLPAPWLRGLRNAGLMTYPLYLLHEPIGHTLRHAFLAQGMPPVAAALLGIAGTALAALAVASLAEPLLRRALQELLRRKRGDETPEEGLSLLRRSGGVI